MGDGVRYQVRLLGPVDEGSRRSFEDLELDVVSDGRLTVLSGNLDQPALHGLLERLRAHHLVLSEVRRVRRPLH